MNAGNRTPIFQLTSAMIIYGTLGLLCRYLPVPSALLALVRGMIGMLFLMVLVKICGKSMHIEQIRANWQWLMLSGVALGLDWILLFESYRYTTVATATLCYYTAPVMVILASAVLFGERITPRKGICMITALVGMALASGVSSNAGTGNPEAKGVLLGMLAAVLYAVMILINRKLRHVDSYDRAITQLAAAVLVLVPYNLKTVDFSSIPFSGLTIFLLLMAGILHTGVAYALYFSSMATLPAQTIAIMSYVDPIVAVLLSALILRESLTQGTILGAILMLGSMMISELPVTARRRLHSRPKLRTTPNICEEP